MNKTTRLNKTGQEVWVKTYIDKANGFKYIPATVDYRLDNDVHFTNCVIRWSPRENVVTEKPNDSDCLNIRTYAEFDAIVASSTPKA